MLDINYKILGSILMLLGTCIGAGMLALPLAAAQYSYIATFSFLSISWLIMTIGAFALLEVNLWMPSGSNLFTMAKNTLGNIGNIISVIVYLLLLYSLIAAYISGCSDLLQGFIGKSGYDLLYWQSTLIVFTVLGSVILFGIRIIDMTNRMLMFVKIVTLIIILSLMFYKFDFDLISSGDISGYSINSIMVMITAFGFAIIIPSLRAYLEDDHHNLIRVLAIGSCIPLLVYSLWILAVHGIIPKYGDNGLVLIAGTVNPNTNLISAISTFSGYAVLSQTSKIFITISAITSFLGVALCLVDFYKDIIKTIYARFMLDNYVDDIINTDLHHHVYIRNILAYFLAFSVPLIMVLYNPGIFITALSYAGILVIMFLVIIPLLMLYIGRYHLDYVGRQFLPGGKSFILILLAISMLVLLYSVYMSYLDFIK